MNYRPAFLSDEHAVRQLTSRGDLHQPGVFVAECHDRGVIAVAVVIEQDKAMYLDHLIVEKDMRGKMVGSHLVQYICAEIEEDVPLYAVSVGLDSFYRRNGFDQFGTVWER